jgi:hypothetical protein
VTSARRANTETLSLTSAVGGPPGRSCRHHADDGVAPRPGPRMGMADAHRCRGHNNRRSSSIGSFWIGGREVGLRVAARRARIDRGRGGRRRSDGQGARTAVAIAGASLILVGVYVGLVGFLVFEGILGLGDLGSRSDGRCSRRSPCSSPESLSSTGAGRRQERTRVRLSRLRACSARRA